MPATTDPRLSCRAADRDGAPERSLGRRLAWFAVLWLLGVAAVGALAYGIRLFLA